MSWILVKLQYEQEIEYMDEFLCHQIFGPGVVHGGSSFLEQTRLAEET